MMYYESCELAILIFTSIYEILLGRSYYGSVRVLWEFLSVFAQPWVCRSNSFCLDPEVALSWNDSRLWVDDYLKW